MNILQGTCADIRPGRNINSPSLTKLSGTSAPRSDEPTDA